MISCGLVQIEDEFQHLWQFQIKDVDASIPNIDHRYESVPKHGFESPVHMDQNLVSIETIERHQM